MSLAFSSLQTGASTPTYSAGSLPMTPKLSWTCLQDVLRDRAGIRQSGHLIFYPFGDITNPTAISYCTLYARARQNSLNIRNLPRFEEGQPVLLLLDDPLEAITWFWSVLLANGVPVVSPPFHNIEDHRHKQQLSLSALLESPICITSESSLHLFDHSHLFRINTIESLAKADISLAPCATDSSPSREDQPAILMLTSGSTGTPKAVCLSHHQILSAVSGKASVRTLPTDHPFLNWVGLDHVASLVEIHLQAMWLGVDQIHVHAADIVSSPIIFLDLLDRHQVSRSFAPNFFLAKLVSAYMSASKSWKWDLSGLTILASGGEANDVELCVEVNSLLQNYGAPCSVLAPGFGMTETCAGAIFNLDCPNYDVNMNHKTASVGKCMRGIEMRITVSHDSSKLAQPDEPGNLEVRGEVVFNGYYRNAEATAQSFSPDGWFRTGDQGIIDQEGNLSLVGRVKDVFNVNGVKVMSSDIQVSLEQALNNHVARVVCFPSRGAYTEQVTVAYVPREWPTQVEYIMEIESLAEQACMVHIASRPVVFPLGEHSASLLPISTLGKISRAKMRALYESGIFSKDVDLYRTAMDEFKREKLRLSIGTMNETEACFVNDFVKILGIDSGGVGPDTTVFEMGFTSMDLIRLHRRIEHRLNVTIPLITLMKHSSARSLAIALRTSHGQPSQGSHICDDYDPVVTFQSGGSKTPLWLVHPGVGEVLVFVGLAQYIGKDNRPIYGLRARGFEPPEERFRSISEAVETYTAAIRKRQPQGPYALAGYSYGTMIAFEITKKLEAGAGNRVQFLGSLNLPPHIKMRMRQLNWNICLLHLTYFLGLTTETQADHMERIEFRNMSRPEALSEVLGITNKARMDELGLTEQALTRWAEVAYGLQSMAVEYEPEGIVDVIDVFHAIPLKIAAATRDEWLRVHLSKWGDFCRTKPRFHEVSGTHYTMIGPEYVESFSVVLQAALRERGL
ncbi:hypothetical protein F4677DRAFT_439359 [Hypoxylon crocopeplum]|nr:hypothetical protein F4677DRAFT_439359 [Hypoxylon crocopeplum]